MYLQLNKRVFSFSFVLTNMGYGHVVDQGWLQADAALAVMGSTLLLPAFLWFIRQKTVSAVTDLDPVKSVLIDCLPSNLCICDPELHKVICL